MKAYTALILIIDVNKTSWLNLSEFFSEFHRAYRKMFKPSSAHNCANKCWIKASDVEV